MPVSGCRHWIVDVYHGGVIAGSFCGRPAVGLALCIDHWLELDKWLKNVSQPSKETGACPLTIP